MNDNDVILWQARILAGQASMIDQMGRGLNDAQKAVEGMVSEGMVSDASLDGAHAEIADLMRLIREQEDTISSRVHELNELREVRNKQAQVIADLEQAVKNRDTIIERQAARDGVIPASASVGNTESAAAHARLMYGMMAGIIERYNLQLAEVRVYLHVMARGGHVSPSREIAKALGMARGTPAAALKRLRHLGLVAPAEVVSVSEKQSSRV